MAFVPVYILILGFTIIIDYYAGMLIEKSTGKRRKIWLIVSLAANIGVLAIFKYYNFLNDNLTALLSGIGKSNPIPYLKILLPIGLSFHTFQAMSYTIEVYRGNQKAERHFGIYSLYVMFYPQLVAGPIERPQNLLFQFYKEHKFEYNRVIAGLQLMLWGLFKKLVIADRLSIYVDSIYNNAEHHNGPTFIVATVFFAFQIYCDFSGYSDIAIGSAKVMGFDLMTNFRRPYFATSISEFWKRWHISLSTWFKDYLYISLGGNRVTVPRMYFNLFFVFLISGLWHGANWTFIIWGALNGIYLIFALISQKYRDRFNEFLGIARNRQFHKILQILVTFALVCFSWIFFRAANFHDSSLIIHRIFTTGGSVFIGNMFLFIYCILAILLLLGIELRQELKGQILYFNSDQLVLRNISYMFLILLILLIGVFDGGQFIYFQF
ncbi:MBOAT family O-acyltransferase [Flavihumibacter profundi]|uniref:MBOAT family O-acyltransferase n=1 Tax=Flavihumibacter profundi TaxID=2716883 RepID=UPI001CC39013|nr:MBOAT family O-acyltransferase [Flavihumibacter profundi]MBZ5855775.1 MBOAT family protein [Flavihumibacter profundi]